MSAKPVWCQPAMSRVSVRSRWPGAGEPAQHASAHLLLHRGEMLCQRCRLGEADLAIFARAKHPIDHTAVESTAPSGW